MFNKINAIYRQNVLRVAPYIIPVLATLAVKGTFNNNSQTEQIYELQNINKMMQVKMTGLSLLAYGDNGDDVYKLLKNLVNSNAIDANTIPAFHDPEYFAESFDKQSTHSKQLFVSTILYNMDNPNSSKPSYIEYIPKATALKFNIYN
jgi:hypothetical protein